MVSLSGEKLNSDAFKSPKKRADKNFDARFVLSVFLFINFYILKELTYIFGIFKKNKKIK